MTHLPQPAGPTGSAPGAPPYGSPYAAPPPPGPLPQVAVDYHQLLRGPRRRWWRPVLSLLLVSVLLLAGLFAAFGLGDALDAVGPAWLGSAEDDLSPVSTLTLDLALAALIPASGLAIWAVHRIRPGYVSSVVGGIRWRWLARCVAVTLPVWAVYMLVGSLSDPPASGRPDQWVVLLVMALVLTPFQAAGEEYLFRGWLVQNVGSLFRARILGLVVSTVCSAALFSLAHGSFDVWVVLNISTLAVAACLANWRTGGLEAGIAMHLVNNVAVGVVTITVGGYADSFVSTETTGTPLEAGIGIVVHLIAVALILWQGRRTGVQRQFQPAVSQSLTGTAAARPTYVLEEDRPIWTAPLG